ncbi:aldolase/citrate lyase/malate synthase family protein [Balneatrix alpica]|uniref:malate synthase n=1 Tax=Balneatrix alpica TaxID=75684 RepID=A0ABV5Z7D2_9GAMM|nr:hypothetical protein [Balneatrix alpica]
MPPLATSVAPVPQQLPSSLQPPLSAQHGHHHDMDSWLPLQQACPFLLALLKRFESGRQQLLKARELRQANYRQGARPDFCELGRAIREDNSWRIAAIPARLQSRQVEWLLAADQLLETEVAKAAPDSLIVDFEDSFCPTAKALQKAHQGLRQHLQQPHSYSVQVRVRGLHLTQRLCLEQANLVANEVVSASLFDFALCVVPHLAQLREASLGFYLPKLESYQEAAWWAEVLAFAEDFYLLPRGSIKVSVLIESLSAALQMDEILYCLRHHVVALSWGRWDYIHSYIKTHAEDGERLLPDPQVVNMNQAFLDAYSRLLIRTCHKRGALALGGIASWLAPAELTELPKALEQEKRREIDYGHDGTWVASPHLIAPVKALYQLHLAGQPNQLRVWREQDEPIAAKDLLNQCEGKRTEAGVRHCLRIALGYLTHWLSGQGVWQYQQQLEEAASAEIASACVWHWLRHQALLADGRCLSHPLLRQWLAEEQVLLASWADRYGWQPSQLRQAASWLQQRLLASQLSTSLWPAPIAEQNANSGSQVG